MTLTLILKETRFKTQADKQMGWCFAMLLDSDTDRQARSEEIVVTGACAFQEGLFGKAGPEAPAPDGGPP